MSISIYIYGCTKNDLARAKCCMGPRSVAREGLLACCYLLFSSALLIVFLLMLALKARSLLGKQA